MSETERLSILLKGMKMTYIRTKRHRHGPDLSTAIKDGKGRDYNKREYKNIEI